MYVQCTYIVRTLYVQARTYGFGTDNIRNESFLDVRVCTYNVRTKPYVQCTYIAVRALYVRSNTKTIKVGFLHHIKGNSEVNLT